MSVETLQRLAWTSRPISPLGIRPEYRRRYWFRWHVIYRLRWIVWEVRTWLWKRRTGNKQDWCW